MVPLFFAQAGPALYASTCIWLFDTDTPKVLHVFSSSKYRYEGLEAAYVNAAH
jgi:hypothetical protein